MRRSFSIGLITLLVGLAAIPQAQALPTYQSSAWARITGVEVFSGAASEPAGYLANSYAYAQEWTPAAHDTESAWSPWGGSLKTDASADSGLATVQAGTAGSDYLVSASASAFEGKMWAGGFGVSELTYTFTVTESGPVTIRVAYDLGYDLDVSPAHRGELTALAELQLFGAETENPLDLDSFSLSKSRNGLWEGDDDRSGFLEATATYSPGACGNLLIRAETSASYGLVGSGCTTIPAPVAVVLGMIGTAGVVVLRRRRVI
jgi:hypothetical protein